MNTVDDIPREEDKLLESVLASVGEAKATPFRRTASDHERQLLELRDEIAGARLEDIPALVAQMERVAGVAARRAEVQVVPVDASAPYFAHLRLREDRKVRDVLIGRTTHIDPSRNVRIVDWRHAPVSQLYYRYPEGASYEETFGGRDVEGEVLVRRTVTIHEGELLRVHAPQGVFARRSGDREWRQLAARSMELSGGQGSAMRPQAIARGVFGVGSDADQRLDRHLPEIAALLDPRQFELISAPDAGVVVIQGGAGSGKTTIGLHRVAYLAYRDPERFAPDRMLVITYGIALAAYIGEVLPALGVHGVKVQTFTAWAEAHRRAVMPLLEVEYDDDTPSAVTRLKKHPGLLAMLEKRAREHVAKPRAGRAVSDILNLWAEALTDLEALRSALIADGDPMQDRDLLRAHRWCTERCVAIADHESRREDHDLREDHTSRSEARESRRESRPEEDNAEEQEPTEEAEVDLGIDGRREEDFLRLDREDDALLLRLHQIMVGPLMRGRHSVVLEHLFVDEAQDLSPVELAVLLAATSPRRSVTLAGDTAQKLYLDNGFRDWRTTLKNLGLASTEIEPLRIAYRSTREVMAFARDVLGPLADPDPPAAPRSGAEVEAHMFPGPGAAVAFLADALRPLFAREPHATVAVLARYPEQADAYYEGLLRSEVAGIRRVRAQDFTFRPGIDVTDIRQVKGLEYDYVVVVDVNSSVFPAEDQARHLLHIAATRAAHQLWIIVSGPPSPLLPSRLIDA